MTLYTYDNSAITIRNRKLRNTHDTSNGVDIPAYDILMTCLPGATTEHFIKFTNNFIKQHCECSTTSMCENPDVLIAAFDEYMQNRLAAEDDKMKDTYLNLYVHIQFRHLRFSRFNTEAGYDFFKTSSSLEG